MLPNEQVEFYNLVTELFAVHGRVAQKPALNAWWVALKSRGFNELNRVIRKLIEESTELPTPARVVAILRDEKPATVSSKTDGDWSPRKTTLIAARRHLEMFGEQEARAGYGDYAVNIILNNPKEGYPMTDARAWGGKMPDYIQAEIQSGVRKE